MGGSREGGQGVQTPPPAKLNFSKINYIIELPKICFEPPPDKLKKSSYPPPPPEKFS